MKIKETWKKRPNILFMMVDEERFPPHYESGEIKEWRKQYLKTHEALKKNGLQFLNHYVGSTACSPSRTTLYTGHYPSLHGVTQTTGAAKDTFDPDVYWLDPNTVPTIGDYFRAAGYRTFWIGKWHASVADIYIPGTREVLLSYNPITGVPIQSEVDMYKNANRLDGYGFSGWVGPEPHGTSPRNSGSSASIGLSGRDEVYAEEAVQLIQFLDAIYKRDDTPWFIMCSFVNPHDIALFGKIAELLPQYNFEIDPTVPSIPQAPTANETLLTKPDAQESYRKTYPKAFQPTVDTNFFRQLYYSLHLQVDREMFKVFDALKNSSFYEDTIVVFTSDHGDLLGAHGGLFQKWYNMYEEAIHVPFIIHNPMLFPKSRSTTMLTSHVDILPTLLGLANIDEEEIQQKLRMTHTEVRPLVGRNLKPLIEGKGDFERENEPLYFMTEDDVTKGFNQISMTGEPYDSVVQPNHIEAIIVSLKTGKDEKEEIWKFARYYEKYGREGTSEQFEMYNLTADPLEEKNLAHPTYRTEESKVMQQILLKILKFQSQQKRLTPRKNFHYSIEQMIKSNEEDEDRC